MAVSKYMFILITELCLTIDNIRPNTISAVALHTIYSYVPTHFLCN